MSGMKVKIEADERYPVYRVYDYGYEVDVAPETLERWRRAEEVYEAAQDEMEELFQAAQEVAQRRDAEERAAKEAEAKAERERVAAERRRVAAEREAKERAMWQRIEAAGGVVYDADGNPLGTVSTSQYGGAKIRP